ncbi:Peptidoglycan/xylan/chitin deacetylase, PgdA/CDA1 family [Micromonospora haikouensis]|uniref:Peptidoglycan/xylan/chitin deacetylase, PgdA/CDA1 family n=1 Tax=Micromonospora haikouensis TaxID=686309 RepID=A0A1C4Y4I3_9ACTN|nr:polysaccharide deacetylase family protein [Micromonospora haikouensis]SCF15609.1 Peptidoglycan/xylan/chitin deacetylase, PgdA/CDA1 family [Micromonospora haikouensis]
MRPVPAPRPGVSADIVDTTRGGGRVLGLTFDDGPNPADTPRLLDVLRRHGITAVFCLWGEHVDAHPDVVRRIVADGHTLGNHSMRHEDMSSWSAERIEADLREADAAIRRAVPGARIPYFRAPYGAWGRTPAVAAAMGMRPLGWQLALGDWDPPGTDELVRRLRDGITPGAVVLLHDGGGDRSQTVDAVERVVPVLAAEGWRFALPRRPDWP